MSFEGTDYPEERGHWEAADADVVETSPTDAITCEEPADGTQDIDDRAPDDTEGAADLAITAPLGDTVEIAEDAPEPAQLQGPRLPFESTETARITNRFEPSGNVAFAWISDSATIFMQCQPSREESNGAEIGGVGITRRTLEHVEGELPGITNRLKVETGKVVFLGNGLSTAALEAYQDNEPGTAPERVLVDAIDYRSLHSDLHALRADFDARLVEVPPSLEDAIAKCDAIIEAADIGLVRLVQHVVGSAPMPDAARNADLAVNVFGPPLSTVDDQLTCLKPSGTLWVSGVVEPRTNHHMQPLGRTASLARGYIISTYRR